MAESKTCSHTRSRTDLEGHAITAFEDTKDTTAELEVKTDSTHRTVTLQLSIPATREWFQRVVEAAVCASSSQSLPPCATLCLLSIDFTVNPELAAELRQVQDLVQAGLGMGEQTFEHCGYEVYRVPNTVPGGMLHTTSGEQVQVYKYELRLHGISIQWAYLPDCQTTIALAVVTDQAEREMVATVVQRFQTAHYPSSHPLWPCLAAHEAISLRMGSTMSRLTSGVRSPSRLFEFNAQGDLRASTIPDTDLVQRMSDMISTNISLATVQNDYSGLLDLATFLLAENERLGLDQTLTFAATSRPAPARTTNRVPAPESTLLDLLGRMCLSRAKAGMRLCSVWQFKSSNQSRGLLAVIAQRDQQFSIQLAKDSKEIATASKRDSSMMKAIAAVTMFFLPGTFTAVSWF